jgi:hypothetical protein
MACLSYAVDHDGKFPPSLGALVPDYLPEALASALYHDAARKNEPRWEYRKGLKATDDAEEILLKSTKLHSGTRIVARVDGSVHAEQENAEVDEAAKHPQDRDDEGAATQPAERRGEGADDQEIADRKIPSKKVTGKLNGARFVPERVELKDGSLRFRTGEGFDMRGAFDMHGFDIQIPGGAKDLANKTFIATPRKRLEGCEVDIFYPDRSTTPPSAEGKTLIFGNYSLKLEFGAVTGRKLPGQIYLNIEKYNSHIEGAFEVSLD